MMSFDAAVGRRKQDGLVNRVAKMAIVLYVILEKKMILSGMRKKKTGRSCRRQKKGSFGMRALTEKQICELEKSLPDTDQGKINYGYFAKKEISRIERKARDLKYLISVLRARFPRETF